MIKKQSLFFYFKKAVIMSEVNPFNGNGTGEGGGGGGGTPAD